jgi:hypothetical protein
MGQFKASLSAKETPFPANLSHPFFVSKLTVAFR